MIYFAVDDSLSIIEAENELYLFLNCATTQEIGKHLDDNNKSLLKDTLKKLGQSIIEFNIEGKSVQTLIKVLDKHEIIDGRTIYNLIMIDLESFVEKSVRLKNDNYILSKLLEFSKQKFFIYDKQKKLVHIFYNFSDTIYSGDIEGLTNLENEYKILYNLLSADSVNINYDGRDFQIKASFNYYNKENVMIGVIENKVNDLQMDRFDFLTGLYNKKTFIDYALKNIENECTIMIVDIDNFKEINDNFGHKTGDDIIKIIANEIKQTVGTYGIVGRFGGDEFTVFLATNDELHVRSICEAFRIGVQTKTIEMNIPVTVSIGISRSPIDTQGYDNLFEIADKALYIAKNKGKNRYIIYRDSMHKDVVNKRSLLIENIFVDLFKIYSSNEDQDKKIDLIFEKVLNVFEFSQICVYKNNQIKRSYGDYEEFEGIMDEKHAKLFDSKGVLVIDNAMPTKASMPTVYNLFENQDLWSFVQILLKDDSDNIIGYVSFEDKIDRRSFNKSELNVLTTLVEILKNSL